MKKIAYATLVLLSFIFMINIKATNFPINLEKYNLNDKAGAKKSNLNVGCTSPYSNTGFWENKGQILGTKEIPSERIKFVLKSENTEVFLLNFGLAYQFIKVKEPIGYRELLKSNAADDIVKLGESRKKIETYRMDLTLVGANPDAKMSKQGKSDYFMNFASQEIYDIHYYEKVTYHDIYPGIDWVVYFKEDKIKYDFVVKPGADPSIIKMTFSNHEIIKLNQDGSFTLKNKLGSVTEKKPVSFQGKDEIETRFKLNRNELYFELDNYDISKELIIDPAVIWATYYGGAAYEFGSSCATDALGNVYLAGNTTSSINISSGGYQSTYGGGGDAFLVKFNSSGIRQWATYYGGTGLEAGNSCTTDALGNVYLAGNTESSVNIASGGHQNSYGGSYDAYLVKFNSSGIRQWATYYGGAAYENARSCATDALGNVYMVGTTESTVNIASGGHQNSYGGNSHDAFLVKFNSSGIRQWATYYGGTGIDFCYSCVTDVSGNVYMAGTTGSSSNIASGGHQNSSGGGGNDDAYLVKFNGSGVRQWATYYGGSGSEWGSSCVTDASGNVYLAGITTSSVNVASSGYQNSLGGNNDAFLVKFNGSGIRQWATYYGDSGNESAFSCATDASGNVYMAGETASTVNIAYSGYQNSLGGNNDAYLVKFDNSGARLWATYYGGAGDETGYTCATDVSGNVYLAGSTQSTVNISSGGHQTNFGGGIQDAYLVKFCNNPIKPSAIIGNTLSCGSSIQTFSVSNDLTASSYSWSLPTGWLGSSNINVITCTLTATGVLTVNALNSCAASLAQTLNVVVEAIPFLSVNSGSICAGNSFTIIPSGAHTYTITGGNFVVNPVINSNYSITGTSASGCVASNTVVASVLVYDTPSITVNSATICSGNSVVITPTAAGISLFNITGGTFTVSPTINTTYSVTGTGTNGCISSNTGLASVSVNITPTITVNSGTVCSGLSYIISPIGAHTYTITGGTFTVFPITTSTYSIVGSSSEGCISENIAISTITVFETPTLAVNSGSICSGNNFVIIPTGASTYSITGATFTVSPMSTSAYSITGTSSLGCISQTGAICNVTVNLTPTLNVFGELTTICEGESTTFSVSGASGYTWSTGENSNTIVVSPTITTSYTVSGSNFDGCKSFATLSQIVDACTGLKQFSTSLSIQLYPNPNNGEFQISLSELEEATFSVTNILGQKVFETHISKGESVHNTGLCKGIYFYYCHKNTYNFASGRLIIQ